MNGLEGSQQYSCPLDNRGGIVYRIIHIESGRCYVGVTTKSLKVRWQGHVSHSRRPRLPIAKAIAEFGEAAFRIEEVERCDSGQGLCEAEQRWILTFNCQIPHGYNITSGGKGTKGYRLTEAQKQARAAAMTGRTFSQETIAKMAAAKKGLKASEETRRRQSIARTGIRRSEATKAKIGAAHLGRVVSEETRGKLRAARIGFRLPDAAKIAISRKVIVEGVEYPSLNAACEASGLSVATIRRRIQAGRAGYGGEPARARRKRTSEQVEAMRRRQMMPVIAAGVAYSSVTQAAQCLGTSRSVINYRIKAGFEGYALSAR